MSDPDSRLDSLVRFYRQIKTREYRLAFLANQDDGELRLVLDKLDIKTAWDLIKDIRR